MHVYRQLSTAACAHTAIFSAAVAAVAGGEHDPRLLRAVLRPVFVQPGALRILLFTHAIIVFGGLAVWLLRCARHSMHVAGNCFVAQPNWCLSLRCLYELHERFTLLHKVSFILVEGLRVAE